VISFWFVWMQGIIDANVMGGISKYQQAFFIPEFSKQHPEFADHVYRLKALTLDQVHNCDHIHVRSVNIVNMSSPLWVVLWSAFFILLCPPVRAPNLLYISPHLVSPPWLCSPEWFLICHLHLLCSCCLFVIIAWHMSKQWYP